jgi:hypothetical protein
VIVSGDVVVANSGDISVESAEKLYDRVRGGGGLTRVVLPRLEKDYVVVRQRLVDAVRGCPGVIRVVEQTSSGWDRPDLLEAAGRQDLLFEFAGEVPELYRTEELEVSVIRQRLELVSEGAIDGKNFLSAVLEASDRPVRVNEVRGAVVVCDVSVGTADLGSSVTESVRGVDSAFHGFESRLRSFADSMSSGFVSSMSVEPCASCPPLPVPGIEGGRVVWQEDRRWCAALSGVRGSLRLGVGSAVLVAILTLWVKFWAFLVGGSDE